MELGPPIPAKMVVLGESAVGKTSLCGVFIHGQFNTFQEPTIGAAFQTKRKDGIKFEIWDTAGQERYRSLAPMYYRGARAAMIVYDVTERGSLDRAITWMKEVAARGDPDVVMILVGNKKDLETKRKVTEQEGRTIAQQYGVLFAETSAKQAYGVDTCFALLAEKLLAQGSSKFQSSANLYTNNDLLAQPKPKRKCC